MSDNGRDEILKGLHDNPIRGTVSVGWYCGNCFKWHGPHIDTCTAPPRDPRTLGDKIKGSNNG